MKWRLPSWFNCLTQKSADIALVKKEIYKYNKDRHVEFGKVLPAVVG